ncbi:MAG TPA: acyltransferase [Jatrophihabitantaceae bacterium]
MQTEAASERRFPALDGIRAFAAFAVVLTHIGFITGRSLRADLVGPLLSRGDCGVTIFFLLSGFLLYRPFALRAMGLAPRPRVRQFLWRRALRIFPALWLTVVVTLALITTYRVRASDYLQYLLLIQTYDNHDYDPNLTQLWTLAVEIAFYALIPILAALAARGRRTPDAALRRQFTMLAVLAIAALVFNIAENHTSLIHSQALLWLPAYLDWFALGMALAVLTCVPPSCQALGPARRVLGEWARSPGTCMLVAAVLYLISTLPLGIPRTLAPATFTQWTAQHYLYAGVAFFLLLPFVLGDGGTVGRALGSRTANVLGNVSYSVYLWHVPLMLLLQRELGYREFHGHFLELLMLTVVSTLAIASASWFWFERPILRYGTRPWRRTGVEVPTAEITTAARQSS